MKKFIWLLSIVSLFGLASCGDTSSKEAKELLSRLLNIVGIPHNIVVNICQDNNDNGFCESTELQAKIRINKGDSIDDIWEKVSLDENGSYLLTHHDPSKKILMELQDSENVHNENDGKFVFTYNPMSTELSILQMMVDAGHLEENQTVAIKQLERQDKDKFYAILLKDLETNLNILGAEGLTDVQAMSGNVKEMAEELIINGIANTLPQNINNCRGDLVCVDNELAVLSDELLIDENESVSIKESETKSLKTLLAEKTLYSTIYNKMGTLESVTFNDDLTSATWEELVGGSDIDTSSISMNEMTLTSTDSDGAITIIVVTEIKEDYMLISVDEKEAQRLYFDESKAREYFLTDSKELAIIGKWGDESSIYFTFNTDKTYIFVQHGKTEKGTYTWNSDTGAFSNTVTSKDEGEYGLNVGKNMNIKVIGDYMYINADNEDERVVPRIS